MEVKKECFEKMTSESKLKSEKKNTESIDFNGVCTQQTRIKFLIQSFIVVQGPWGLNTKLNLIRENKEHYMLAHF